MRRREFIAVLRSVAAWPVAVAGLLRAAGAQQPSRVRRVGVLMNLAVDDWLGQTFRAVFAQGMQQFCWDVGGNVLIDYRWGTGDTDQYRKYAAELVALGPDVIVATAASIVRDLQQVSRTVPIVFVTTIDPVGSGLVTSLARPGGNATGFAA